MAAVVAGAGICHAGDGSSFGKEDYNPEVDDELLKILGDWEHDELLVLVTVTVPQELEKMTVNLKGPILINGKIETLR